MSYDIVYDKQFIKVTDELFIPMILAGSSNCYDMNDKRSRSWGNQRVNGNITGTVGEMVNQCNRRRAERMESIKERNEANGENEVYKDSEWGWYTGFYIGGNRSTTFGMYKGMYVTGCKKALTPEELFSEGISIHLSTLTYGETREKMKAAGLEDVNEYVNTSGDLMEALLRHEKALKGITQLYVSITASENGVAHLRRKYFNPGKKPKTLVKADSGFAIKIENTGYFIKNSRNGYRYAHYATGGKQFLTEAKARPALKRFLAKHSDKAEIVVVDYGTERGFWE